MALTAANAQAPKRPTGAGHDMPGMSNMGDMKGMSNHNDMAMSECMTAMKRMGAAMMAAKGMTADASFAKKMVAHHQGAIDMAQIELEHGVDADAKRIAEKTIQENSKGMSGLENRLTHGG